MITAVHDTLSATVDPLADNSAGLVASLTQYARCRSSSLYGPCPPGVERQLWAAYGPRFPDGHRRWLDQQAERDWNAQCARRQAERTEIARALWERVHGRSA